MLTPEFIELLRCPETQQKLLPATPELLSRLQAEQATGRLLYKSGHTVTEPMDGGLVREDGVVFYPVRQGIPVLVPDEAIALTVTK